MASFFLLESGWLLDEAKRAAFDAVGAYERLTPYTIGVAVQAAAAVLKAGEALEPLRPPGPAAPAGAALRSDDSVGSIDITAVEVTPRVRALESVAAAALRTHRLHDSDDAGHCELCAALDELTAVDQAS